MSDSKLRILPEMLREIDSSTLNGTYIAVGSPLANPSRLLKVTNNSDVDIYFSWDGSDDHDLIPANGFLLLDICSNRVDSSLLQIAAQTQFYVKGSAGTGSITISSYYAR